MGKLKNFLIITMLILGLLPFVIALDDANVIASWNFYEGSGTNVLDNATQLYNGTLNAGLGWTTNGKNGNAINNSGTVGRYMTVADSDAFSFTDGSGNDKPFSYCFWVNHSSLTDYQSVVSKWNNSGSINDAEYYDLFYADGKITFTVTNPDSSAYRGRTTSAGVAVANKWEHYCMTYNGDEATTGLDIYKNASVVDIADFTSGVYTGMSNEGQPVIIGHRFGVDTFRGTIDEVIFFNYSLNSSEVAELYNAGAGLFYPFSSTPVVDYSPVFLSQSPSDITISNAVGGVNITYNYSDPNLNVTSPYLNWTVKNSTGGIIYSYVNGSQQPAYKSQPYSNYSGVNYRFFFDDKIYPGTYNLDHDTMSNSVHYNHTLNTVLDLLKVEFYNFTGKTYNIIELNLQVSSVSTFTELWYCNASYTVGRPYQSGFCAFIGDYNFTTCSHYHNQSCHNQVSLSVSGGSFNNITITNTSYVIMSGAGLGSVNVGYVNGTPRTGATQTSSTRGLSYTSVSWLADAHVHFYDVNDYFEYTPYYTNSTGTFNGSVRTDAFNITNLPPSGLTVTINDTFLYYNDVLRIIRNTATPGDSPVNKYAYYIYNSLFTLYRTINSSTNQTEYNYTASNISPGVYYPVIIATDNSGLTDVSIGESFTVNSRYLEPCNERITVNSTGVQVLFNWTTDTLSGYTELHGKVGLLNVTLTNATGYATITNTLYGNYSLYLYQYTEVATGCYLDLCKNNWVQQNQPCLSNLKLVNYTDTNGCPESYDYPADINTYIECVTPPDTDKDLWLIILLLVLWLFGVIACMLWSPLLIIISFLASAFMTHYTNQYFSTPIIGVVMIIFTAFILVVSLKVRRF